jgi:large subunit ribosomal protein L32
MAVPKRRKSRSKRDSRRANYKLGPAVYNDCSNCSAPKEPHRICGVCGWYKDRYVLEVVEVEV